MRTKISSFLKERPDRFKPDEAGKLGLQRIEKITQKGEIFISDKPSNTNMILVKPGDLVISGIGIAKGGGNSLNVYEGKENVLTTIHYSSYEINKNLISQEFLKIFLISPYFKKLLQENSPNGIKAEIKSKNFLPIELELPSLERQQEIIKKIQSIEKEIKQLETNIIHDKSLLTSFKQLILSEAVQGKLVKQDPNDEPASELLNKIKSEKERLIKEGKIKKDKPLSPITKEEIPYELPKGWEWVRLNDLVSILGDGLHGTPSYTDEGEYSFINGNNLSDGEILIKVNTKRVSSKEYEKYKKDLTERSILVSINGTLGNVAFYNNEKVILGKSACYFNLISKIDKDYIKILIKSPHFLEYVLKNATRTTIDNVSLQSMRLLPIPLPPLVEQKRIVEKVDKLMVYCDELEKQVKANQGNSEKLMVAVLMESFEQ